MRIGDFATLLERALPKRKKLLAVGPAGIGKTQVPTDLARRWGWDVKSICMPLVNPTFLMGYPYRENGTAGHLPFGVLGECLKAERDTMLIMDEMGGASTETVKSGLRLFQFGEVGGKRLPECVRIIALSNDVGHGADVMGIIEPMKDRFDSIVNVEPHIDDTVNYGLTHNWPSWLLAFLRNATDALHDLKPQKSMQRSGATPRGWEAVAGLDADGLLDTQAGSELVCGAVGKGRGTQAMAYRDLAAKLPDVDEVLMNPDNAPVPENPSARFFIAMALAAKMNGANFGVALRYLNRLPAMFRAFSIRDAATAEFTRIENKTLPKDWPRLVMSRDFTAWSASADGQEITQAWAPTNR